LGNACQSFNGGERNREDFLAHEIARADLMRDFREMVDQSYTMRRIDALYRTA
jgi:hypothetical protein